MIPSSSSPIHCRPATCSSIARRRQGQQEGTMMYRDNSLFNATRCKEQENRKLQKSMQCLDTLSLAFEEEVSKLRNRQRKLAQSQRRMAKTALSKYSVYLIQAVYRGYKCRKYCREFRSRRFLGQFLTRRYIWKKRSMASKIIKRFYKKYKHLRMSKETVMLNESATVIQSAYRQHFRVRRAVLRRVVKTLWKHVALFGNCRALNSICSNLRYKRIIFRAMTRFYSRLRRKRLENHFNAYKLVYGIFFATSSTARKLIKSRASSIVGERFETLQGNRGSVVGRINRKLIATKIENASYNVQKRATNAATTDILHWLRGRVLNEHVKRFSSDAFSNKSTIVQRESRRMPMLSRNNSLSSSRKKPISSARKTESSVQANGRSSNKIVQLSPVAFELNNSPTSRLSEYNGSHRRRALDSISEGSRQYFKFETVSATMAPSFDDVFRDYFRPKRLMKYRSTSQIDPNSMFANLKDSGSNKFVPFELRGNYRLKTLADVVFFINDLALICKRNPLLLQNPIDRKPPPKTMSVVKLDKSPIFVDTYLPFKGISDLKKFRRGAFSYDVKSISFIEKLGEDKLPAGKRAMLRQHILKCFVLWCQQESFNRSRVLNPMRKNPPAAPSQNISAIDKQFSRKFEEPEETKPRRTRRPKRDLLSAGDRRRKENLIRNKIMEVRKEILKHEEIMGVLGDNDEDSDTSCSSSSSDGDSSSSFDDINDDDFAHKFSALAPNQPVPSFRFQRRRNLSQIDA